MSERATVADEHAAQVHANRVAILEMIGGMACFVVSDALIKYASQTMPAAQLILIRGIVAVMLVLAVAKATGATARIREAAHSWVAARSIIDAVGSMLFLVSLFHLPIGSATAINMHLRSSSPFSPPSFSTRFRCIYGLRTSRRIFDRPIDSHATARSQSVRSDLSLRERPRPGEN